VTSMTPIGSSRSAVTAIATAAFALAVLLALAPAAPAHSTVAAKRCGWMGFTPQSDDVAADIRAAGVSCRFARKFVRDSNGRPARSYRGFTCAPHRVDREDALVHTRYRCTKGSQLIRWKRY
jgi:hypothetical protein